MGGKLFPIFFKLFKSTTSFLLIGLMLSFTCYNPEISSFNQFNQLENYNPDLKACLDKVENLCKMNRLDLNRDTFDKMLRDSFNKAKTTGKFKQFYCENFKQGKVDFDSDRKCDSSQIELELKKMNSCGELVEKTHEDFDTINSLCDENLMIQMKQNYLTKEVETKFTDTLKNVVSGYKQIYKDNPEVELVLNQISKSTNFDYRLTTMVAGARNKNDFFDCIDGQKLSWCEANFIIVPGGRVFSDAKTLELILAHEVGHIINKVELPTEEFNQKVSEIKSCNHLNSKIINNSEIENETSADIHMSRYYKKFMKTEISKTHFCHYKAPKSYEKANYLHPYHRQALLNCF